MDTYSSQAFEEFFRLSILYNDAVAGRFCLFDFINEMKGDVKNSNKIIKKYKVLLHEQAKKMREPEEPEYNVFNPEFLEVYENKPIKKIIKIKRNVKK